MTDWTDTTPEELLQAHLNRPANTRRAYAGDVWSLAKFLDEKTPLSAVTRLANLAHGAARRVLGNYMAWLRERHSLNTARRRMGCVRGLLRLAHEYGIIPWAIVNMPLPTPEPIRDTRGPSRAALDRILTHCQQRADAKGDRDLAIVRLMGVCGYRCGEVLSLDVQNVDLTAGEIDILGKGNWGTGRRRWPIDIRTAQAIGRWLDRRGLDDGPLFTTLARGRVRDGDRLTYPGIYDLATDLGRRSGAGHCHPHAFRHTAATEFLRLTNGNVAWAMALTRHRDPKTVMIYNDDRLRRARSAMEIVAAGHAVYRVGPDTHDNS